MKSKNNKTVLGVVFLIVGIVMLWSNTVKYMIDYEFSDLVGMLTSVVIIIGAIVVLVVRKHK